MKIFANKYIKQFFTSILICAAVYALAALSIVFSGLDDDKESWKQYNIL